MVSSRQVYTERNRSARIIIFLITALITYHLSLITGNAFAHVLKTDGNIGAVLHIDPEDDPIARQQSGFFFEFKDKDNKFKPQNCNCTFEIFEDNKQIYSQPLFQNNTNPGLTSPSIFYTFPQKDVYQIRVVGKPNTPNAFQPFSLVYDIRVSRESAAQPSNPANQIWLSKHLPQSIAAIIISIFVIASIVKQKLSKGGES